MGLARKNELPCCVSGPRATVPIRRFFLTRALAAKASTEIVASDVLRKKDRSNVDLITATAYQPLLYRWTLDERDQSRRTARYRTRNAEFDPHLLHQLSQTLMATARPTVFRLLRSIATFSLRKNSEAK